MYFKQHETWWRRQSWARWNARDDQGACKIRNIKSSVILGCVRKSSTSLLTFSLFSECPPLRDIFLGKQVSTLFFNPNTYIYFACISAICFFPRALFPVHVGGKVGTPQDLTLSFFPSLSLQANLTLLSSLSRASLFSLYSITSITTRYSRGSWDSIHSWNTICTWLSNTITRWKRL